MLPATAQISFFILKGGERGERGRLRAQDTGAERHARAACRRHHLCLTRRKAALRPHEQRIRRRIARPKARAKRGPLLILIAKEELSLAPALQEVLERLNRADANERIPAALLCRLVGDLLPAKDTRRLLFRVVAHDAVLARDREDRRRAQLDRLLHDELHLVAFQKARR